MLNLYNKYILPKITNILCNTNPAMRQRQKVVPLAYGQVLEVGVGTGLNFKYYDQSKVSCINALDPSDEMWAIALQQIDEKEINLKFIKAFAEQIPLENNSMDSILITYTLCTIQNIEEALKEMKRVLKPNGILIFCEHGRAPDPSVRRWQNGLNPLWKKLGGGCNLNRDIPTLIKNGKFTIQKMETMYIPGFKPACYNFWGTAKPIS